MKKGFLKMISKLNSNLNNSAPTDLAQKMDQKLKDVGTLYEKQFLREMVKQMRSTISESSLVPSSMGEKIFREQLDQQYVETWGDNGGIGLGNLIYKQLLNQFGERFGIRDKMVKPKGPLPLDQKTQFKFQNQNTMMFSRDGLTDVATTPITVPWSGRLLGQHPLGEGQNLIEIEHDNGLKSQLVFKGQILGLDKNFDKNLDKGVELVAGQKIGLLSPDSQKLFWKISKEE
jgi:flagellar protein FlgJ